MKHLANLRSTTYLTKAVSKDSKKALDRSISLSGYNNEEILQPPKLHPGIAECRSFICTLSFRCKCLALQCRVKFTEANESIGSAYSVLHIVTYS